MNHDQISGMSLAQIQQYAAAHDLQTVGSRPAFGDYVRDLWQRRGFIWTLASARQHAKNEGMRFGRLWNVLNPLLLIGTYLFVFGFLLTQSGSVENYVGYLAVGVIAFSMTATTMTSGSRAILNNTGLVRALHFPRAVLPIASILTEILELTTGLVVLLVVLPFTGALPSLTWLLLPLAIVIHMLIQLGIVLVLARVVNMSADIWNLIPVAVRVLRYVSGVFFSIAAVTKNHQQLYLLLEYQPFALPLSLTRQALLDSPAVDLKMWLVGAAYAVVLPVVGLWIFWRDEAKYGRG